MDVEIFGAKKAVLGHFCENNDHNFRNFMVTIAKINRKLKKNLILMIFTS